MIKHLTIKHLRNNSYNQNVKVSKAIFIDDVRTQKTFVWRYFLTRIVSSKVICFRVSSFWNNSLFCYTDCVSASRKWSICFRPTVSWALPVKQQIVQFINYLFSVNSFFKMKNSGQRSVQIMTFLRVKYFCKLMQYNFSLIRK